MTLLQIVLPCGWKAKEVLCFLKGLCFKCVLSFRSFPLEVRTNSMYLFLCVYLRVKKPLKLSTYYFCSSVISYLAFQYTLRKAVDRLGTFVSERLSHLPKGTGMQQDKNASLGLFVLSSVSSSSCL